MVLVYDAPDGESVGGKATEQKKSVISEISKASNSGRKLFVS